ncbi:MAG TPA: SDR family NAD(P)-dependent oxidoreductase [Roseiflexaceae bacterium]|nr:SDR family NAD(P)-dependent oxidoreductase [Roseiflexaceae bacterium]
MQPAGKTVIITGASSGIGAATARAFAAAGANVVLAARDEAKLAGVAGELGSRALVVPTDVVEPAAVERLVAETVAVFGRVDILINNAGVGLAAPVAELRAADFERAMAVDLLGPLALTQAVLPHMRRHGSGQLIYVSSVVGLRALPYLGGYAAAKAALDRLTESLRVELRGSGIAVTLVRPGTTRTGFSQHRLGSGHERRRVSSRAATPEQVAQAILKAAAREPRVAYVRMTDRLTIAFSLLAPKLADWMLGRSFEWQEEKVKS